jgi:uncharacterized protein (TIRG00374 family)
MTPARRLVKLVKLFGGVLVTGLCLWLVVRHVEWVDAWRTVKTADAAWLLLGLVLLSTGYASRIMRWWLMLRSMSGSLPFSACFGPFLSSIAVNNVLPFRAGDVLRVMGFRRHLDIAPIPVMSTLVLERLLDLTALLGFFFVGLLQVEDGRFPHAVVMTTGWMAGLCLMMVMLTVLIPHRLKRIADALVLAAERKSWPIVGSVGTGLGEFFFSLSLMRAPRLVAQLLVLSFAIWFLEGGVFLAVARALDIMDIGAGPWFALSTGTLGTLLPSTPGYVGTFDYFTMLGLMAYHVPQSLAAVFALVVHLLLWFPLTVVGLVWLLAHKLKPSQPSIDISPSLMSST